MPEFLKCDADDCDHMETVEAISADLIDKPCPKCGANLLTEADCAVWLAYVRPGIEFATAVGLMIDRQPETDQALLRIGLHENTLTTTVVPEAATAKGLGIPDNVTGIRLCKMKGESLILCKPTMFERGAVAVDTVFRRAAICGAVGPLGATGDFWADLMTDDGSWVETFALSRDAWNSIKNHWARTTIDGGEE